MPKGMSKLQIRAEVLLMLQQLSLFDDIPKYEMDKYIQQFRDSENIDEILEILLKELARCDEKKSQIIAYFLAELGSLEKLKDGLWEYIKDPEVPDTLKDLSGIILKSLGDTTTPEELLSYLNNPDELVDLETQKLMELASINPEAQIDFLDFLFSLPNTEQLNLIKSMSNDSSNKHLANILIPALEASSFNELSLAIIEMLGQTRSPYVVASLNDIINYSDDEGLRKNAKKSLNMLKLAGVNLEDATKKVMGAEICEVSKVYKCYASIIDGAGNQGIIVSRKKENCDILTFSTVINDIDGIVDCFGFYGISEDDYERIINKFKGELASVCVSPEYCKYKLLKAEQINKSAHKPICYEYISWKSLISDVEQFSNEEIISNIPDWSNPVLTEKSDILFSHPVFNSWFLVEKHSALLKKFFNKNLEDILKNKNSYIQEPEKLINQLDLKIKQLQPDVFDADKQKSYRSRLADAAYLLDIQNVEILRNTAASVAGQLSEITTPCDNIVFFDYLLKKSIIEHLQRYQYNLEQEIAPACKSLWKKKKQSTNIDFPSQDIGEIIDILIKAWRKG